MKAEICDGEYCLAAGFDPGVAVARLDDLIGNKTHVLLGHRVGEGATDQALDCKKRLFGIGDRLTLGRLADEALAIVGESDNRRRGAGAFSIFDNFGSGAFHHGHAGIGGAEIDADDFSHENSFLSSRNRWTPKRSG